MFVIVVSSSSHPQSLFLCHFSAVGQLKVSSDDEDPAYVDEDDVNDSYDNYI